jgi:hypothetical protein
MLVVEIPTKVGIDPGLFVANNSAFPETKAE